MALPISSRFAHGWSDGVYRCWAQVRCAPLCMPHDCVHCGEGVDEFATHGLSYKWSTGRLSRHGDINEIIHRSLVSAKIPSRLEPAGLLPSDGKIPDGMTIIPWSCGRLLVWDATCCDTLAPSNIHAAMTMASCERAFPQLRGNWQLVCGHS